MVVGFLRGTASSLWDIGKQVVGEKATSVAGALCDIAVRNHSVGKIFGGASLVLGGSYLVVKSGVVKFKSCCWLKNLQAEVNQSQMAKGVKLLGGAAMIAVGITAIVKGVLELRGSGSSSEADLYRASQMDLQCPKKKFDAPVLFNPDNSELRRIITKFESCSEASHLAKQVYRETPYQIIRDSDSFKVAFKWGRSKYKFYLDTLDPQRAPAELVTPLCGMKHHLYHKMESLGKRCGTMTLANFQKENFDEITYPFSKCIYRFFSKCSAKWSWQDATMAKLRTRSDAWNDYVKNSGVIGTFEQCKAKYWERVAKQNNMP